jgi:plastocyanin
MRVRLVAWLVVVLSLAGFGLTACGSSSHAKAQSNCATQAGAAKATYTGSAQATGRVFDIEATDFSFDPTCVFDVPSGADTLVVHNAGSVLHNVQISAQHVDRDIAPGETVRISVSVGASPLVFVCKYHASIGMAGALIPATSTGTS